MGKDCKVEKDKSKKEIPIYIHWARITQLWDSRQNVIGVSARDDWHVICCHKLGSVHYSAVSSDSLYRFIGSTQNININIIIYIYIYMMQHALCEYKCTEGNVIYNVAYEYKCTEGNVI